MIVSTSAGGLSFFFFSSRRRHTRWPRDWSSDVCSSDLYEAQVRPRSSVTRKTKLRVQLGTIDNDYTGEIGIIIDNNYRYGINPVKWMRTIDGQLSERGTEGSYYIRKGDKLAQLVIQAIPMIEAYEIDELPTTVRGNKGYGSSGY